MSCFSAPSTGTDWCSNTSGEFKDIEYLPASAIQDGVPITFEIGKDERFTDLSELVIKTVVEIQGENGTALTGKQFTDVDSAGTLEKVGMINNLGHSLWEQIVLTINDTKVTESSNNYAYKAMLETLLSYHDAGHDVNSTLEQHHESFRYPIHHVKMKSELLNPGSSNFEFDNVFFGHVPNRLTLCTVENRSMYGVFKKNPFHFKHNGLESLIITVGNETLIRLDFDFVNGQYVEPYDTLMRSAGQYKGSRSVLVDYNDFGNGNTILVFDLTARGECNSVAIYCEETGKC